MFLAQGPEQDCEAGVGEEEPCMGAGEEESAQKAGPVSAWPGDRRLGTGPGGSGH